MSYLRLGSLIWLILIASALPAVAHPESGKPQDTASSPAKDHAPRPQAVIAPQADLWDGGARASMGSFGPVLIACLLGDDAGTRLQALGPEPLHWADADQTAYAAAEPCWLACRYAHAPPLA